MKMFESARKAWYTVRRWWWKGLWNMQVRGLKNLPQSGPFLLCGNHASHLDAPAILAALPVETAMKISTAAAKDVFADYPVRNFFAKLLTNCLPIERNSEFARGLRTLEEVLKRGDPMILFPEGKRSQDGELLPFNLGAAMLAIRTGTPIVPIYLKGVRTALPRRSLVFSPAYVRVIFGEPIDPKPYQDAIREGRMDRREAYRKMTEELKAAILALGGAEIPVAVTSNG
jgi:1-acyl-sn-glycerol-3-phosphate acyltransferase